LLRAFADVKTSAQFHARDLSVMSSANKGTFFQSLQNSPPEPINTTLKILP
jgi:hypothetical protein